MDPRSSRAVTDLVAAASTSVPNPSLTPQFRNGVHGLVSEGVSQPWRALPTRKQSCLSNAQLILPYTRSGFTKTTTASWRTIAWSYSSQSGWSLPDAARYTSRKA